jgi:hypothetical protein
MTIVTCPKCADAVTLPTGASRHAIVRCPLCQEKFTLSELLNTLPPALIVVEDPEVEDRQEEPAPHEAMPGIEAAAGPSFNLIEEADESPQAGGIAIETSTASTATKAMPAAGKRRRAAPRPQRKPKRPGMEVVKIVLGGVAGLVIAQLILWWLPAKWRRDPFKLGPSVSQYASWIVPEQFHGRPAAAPAENGMPGPTATDSPSSMRQGGTNPGNKGNTGLPKRTFIDPNQPPNDGPQAKRANPQTGTSAKGPAGQPEPIEAVSEDGLETAAAAADAAGELDLPDFSAGPATDLDLDADLLQMIDSSTDPVRSVEENAPGNMGLAQPTADDFAQTPPDRTPAASQIAGAPRISPAELRDVLDETVTNTGAWLAAEDQKNQQLVVQSYQSLAKLGEAVTFADSLDSGQQQAVDDLLQRVASDAERVRVLRTVGARWPKFSGRDSAGILLVGHVLATQQEADLIVTKLEVVEGEAPLLVYGPAQAHQPGDRIVILGAIVQQPADRVAGYGGDASQLIWSEYSQALPDR